MSKLRTLLVFAAGYVAGSAAGRQRYEQIRAGAKRAAENPRVQAAAQRAQDTVAEKAPIVAGVVKRTTTEAATVVADKVRSGDESDNAPVQTSGGVQRSDDPVVD